MLYHPSGGLIDFCHFFRISQNKFSKKELHSEFFKLVCRIKNGNQSLSSNSNRCEPNFFFDILCMQYYIHTLLPFPYHFLEAEFCMSAILRFYSTGIPPSFFLLFLSVTGIVNIPTIHQVYPINAHQRACACTHAFRFYTSYRNCYNKDTFRIWSNSARFENAPNGTPSGRIFCRAGLRQKQVPYMHSIHM